MVTYNPPRYLFRRYAILHRLSKGGSFLEIGAGNLKFSQELAKYFDAGVALDFEPSVKSVYESTPKSFQNSVKLQIGDIFDLKTRRGFDSIVACEVLEHIENDVKFLQKVNTLLKTNGQVVISVPAKKKYWTVHDDVVGHVRRYEKADIIHRMKEAGFNNIHVYSYGYPFINILWRLRAIHGKQQAKTKRSWSKEKQTKQSGVSQIPTKYNFMGYIVNQYTFYPLNLISRLFDTYDLSEGYIITAYK